MTAILVLQFLIIWTIISVVIYLALLFTQDRRLKARLNGGKHDKYLLATAHPDDEVMFFGPLINTLLKWNARLRLLCLSSGNFYGVGDLRRHELFNAAKELGLSAEDVSLIDDPRLPDSMRDYWEPDVVLEFVDENCKKNSRICSRRDLSMITFDCIGITKHSNHVSVHRALSSPQCEKHRLISLVSIPFFVQYTGSLTCVPIMLTIWLWKKLIGKRSKRNAYIVVASPNQWLRTIRAMLCHKSQIMWFRVLHLMLSSYLLVNVIEEDLAMNE